MILKDLRYFSNSFFEGCVVQKNWTTNICYLTQKFGPGILCTSADYWYCYCVTDIFIFRTSCSLLKSIVNSWVWDEAIFIFRCMVMNSDTLVVALDILLYTNSVNRRRSN